ncbi:hypothetical protein CY35_08G021000 [Sphagnum magellanicum]|nr:hypothetical protein CY35_08G021000 [Sphagnum magellanicum]
MPATGKRRPVDSKKEDPEIAGFGDETQHFFESSDDEELSDSPLDFSMQEDGRLRLRPDISMDGPKYIGKKSSRKTAFESGDSDEDASLDDEDEKETDGENLQIKFDEGDDNALMEEWQANNAENDELEALNREYDEIRQQEEEMVKNLKGQSVEDHEKGEAVGHQKMLWDRALEVRIALQKMVQGANQMPGAQVKVVLCEADQRIEKAYQMLTKSAISAIDCLLDLNKALIQQNSAITETYAASVNGTGKRERGTQELVEVEQGKPSVTESVWNCINSVHASIVPYRNNSVDRWQRKTQLSTGAAAVKGKLRAFNQSISQQVASVMRDPHKLIERMRLQQSSVHVLGQPVQQVLEKGRSSEGVSAEWNGATEADDGNPETFDDSDFYQQLLREFLESSDTLGLEGMGLHSMKKLHNKKRKTVDRRASKGRKIRYTVHDPLVNFMAPELMVLPPMATKLFANLFGQQALAS